MNVLASLLVLGVLIVIHEAGHFLAATSQGIRVSGFSIGFGPALIKKEINGVTYALRALPLGGFVSFNLDKKCDDWSIVSTEFIETISNYNRTLVLVIEETGWSLIPTNRNGRLFSARLGKISQQLELIATDQWLVVQNRVIDLREFSLRIP